MRRRDLADAPVPAEELLLCCSRDAEAEPARETSALLPAAAPAADEEADSIALVAPPGAGGALNLSAARVLLYVQVGLIAAYGLRADYDYAGPPMMTSVMFATHGLAALLLGALSLEIAPLASRAGRVFSRAPAIGLEADALTSGALSALAVAVALGPLAGRASALQLALLALFASAACALDAEAVLGGALGVQDVGGTYAIFLFGSAFGMAAARALAAAPCAGLVSTPAPAGAGIFDVVLAQPRGAPPGGGGAPGADDGGAAAAAPFAWLGVGFVWVYFPSVVAHSLENHDQQMDRAVLNTIVALASGTLVAFALALAPAPDGAAAPSPDKVGDDADGDGDDGAAPAEARFFARGRLDAALATRGALAGGVAIGACADWSLDLAGAAAVGAAGALAGALAGPLARCICCDVRGGGATCDERACAQFLLPAVAGALCSAIIAANWTDDFFPHGHEQWRYQLLGLCATLAMSVGSGALAGALVAPFGPGLPFSEDELWDEEDAEPKAS